MAKVLNPPEGNSGGARGGGDDAVAASAELLRAELARLAGEEATASAEVLRSIDPAGIDGDDARIAFWVNVYNTLLLHIGRLRPFRLSVLLSLRAFSSNAYEVGGNPYSLNQIEHGVLRCNRRSPSSPLRPFRDGDPRLDSAPSQLDPRVHFVLNCGARSCPPIRVMDAATADPTLDLATRSYIEAETSTDSAGPSVELPGLIKLYGGDFGNEDDRLEYVARYDARVADLMEAHPRPKISYGAFDWRVSKPQRAPSGAGPG